MDRDPFLAEPAEPDVSVAAENPADATLELLVPPDALDRLLRRRGLGGGRWRQAAIEIVWHDTPDGALQARNLALSRSGGQWTLARAAPGDGPWPPGAPAPVLATDADPLAIGFGVLDLPPPIASLRGRVFFAHPRRSGRDPASR